MIKYNSLDACLIIDSPDAPIYETDVSKDILPYYNKKEPFSQKESYYEDYYGAQETNLFGKYIITMCIIR